MKWQWFLGGRIMLWISTILLIVFLFAYITTFVIDPTESMYMKIQNNIDRASIKEISEQYIASLGVIVSKPVHYRFVKYQHEEHFTLHNRTSEGVPILLGTFHEWNNNYYIDISVNLYHMNMLYDTVIHETRHMLVQDLKNQKIIDLSKYTEEIAQNNNTVYNELFNNSIKILVKEQTNGK